MIKELVLNLFVISATMSVLVIIVALLSPLFQKRYMAKVKYWIWVLVAARLLVPIWLSVVPVEAPINVPVDDYVVAELPQPAAAEPDIVTPQVSEPGPNGYAQQENAVDNENTTANTQAIEPRDYTAKEQSPAETAAAETGYSISVIDMAFCVWLAGILGYFIYHGAVILRFRGLLSKATQLSDKSPIYEQLQRVKADMGVKKTIGLYLWEEASSPFLIGLFRRKIVLPAQEYNSEELEIIFRHELTHSKRNDLWYKVFLNIANALHWFNPAVYYMKKCAAKDLEFLCDETVTDGEGFELRKTYSELILQGVEKRHNKKVPAVSTSLGQDAKTIKQRIRGIMSMKSKKKGVAALLCIIVCIALAGSLVSCGSASVVDKAINFIIEGDAESACKTLGYDNAELYSEALEAMHDCGITILSCQIDKQSIKKSNTQTKGEATVEIKVDNGMYWAGDDNGNWSAIAVSSTEKTGNKTTSDHYDVQFAFTIEDDKVLFGDIISVAETSNSEKAIDTPDYVKHMMELLNGCNPESAFARNEFVISLGMPSSVKSFMNKITDGFDEIADGNYNEACDIFGFSGATNKESFNYGMQFVDDSSLTILYATVKEASMKISSNISSAIVTLYVQQDATDMTFGYMQEVPKGIYSMDFMMTMKDNAISIPELIDYDSEIHKDVFEDGGIFGITAPGLTAVYYPGETENSLMIHDWRNDANSDIAFTYDTADFMVELWRILQSYDLTSHYAKFWEFG